MRSASVYLVEDDDAVRASLKTLLRLADWNVADFASVQLELVRSSAGSSQFYDRDTNPDMAQQGMKGFQEFLARPDRADAILDRLEATRQRIFK